MANASSRSSSLRALRARDAGLRRISLTTRALVVGSVAAAGLFSSLAAWAQPGRSKAVRTGNPVAGGQFGFGTSAPANTTPAPATPTTTTPDDGGDLSQPASPPVTAPAPAPTTPTYQYTPPPQQYVPPVVVSGAS